MKGNASDILKNEEVSIVAVKMLKEGHTDNDVIGNSFFIQLLIYQNSEYNLVHLKPNYFKKQSSSSSFLLT